MDQVNGRQLTNLQANQASTGNGGVTPLNPQEAVFTITDALTSGGGRIIGAGGVVRSFSANASYSGNTVTTAVPAPGALALLGLAGFAARRRRA